MENLKSQKARNAKFEPRRTSLQYDENDSTWKKAAPLKMTREAEITEKVLNKKKTMQQRQASHKEYKQRKGL